MAQENVYDNRSLVVKYIHHKLWKKGYVWEVNGHDDSVSNGLMMGRQEDRGGSRHDPFSALHTVLREAGDELERLYQSGLCGDVQTAASHVHHGASALHRGHRRAVQGRRELGQNHRFFRVWRDHLRRMRE